MVFDTLFDNAKLLLKKDMIPFNKPHLTGKEAHYMYEAVYEGKLSGNGKFTKRCQAWFEQRYGFRKCLLTTSGTDALEMCAMLCNLKPGDEVIIPSYTFVSTALAFLREGARVVFADSMQRNPNLDADLLESLITPRTRVIVPVHYAGVACDMDAILAVAEKHNLLVVEDAAQAIDGYYNGRPLGSIGHLAAFSFHETKNITSGGEGGLLVVNDERLVRRAEIIWEKGTNRAEFFRGEVNKYGWVDMGSSFLPSEVNAAFLWAQLENIEDIQSKRKQLWLRYYETLKPLAEKGYFSLPDLPSYATLNAHMFYLVFPSLETRTEFIAYLKEHGVLAVFHYLSLHSSDYYQSKHDGRVLPQCDRFADCLVRLPLFYDLSLEQVDDICRLIEQYFTAHVG
jgi:dTDP-4-amino-4,6-dideoxygalactose transaminase